MTEEFLHHIWKFRLFDLAKLSTTQGEKIELIRPGDYNTNAGPDFFNARLKVGNTVWAGNVEVHINASDWNRHSHQKDKAYNNIVLHVVHTNDAVIRRQSGEVIPTLELKGRINESHFKKYLGFKSSGNWVPCEKQLKSVSRFTINSWLDRLLVERLERKSTAIMDRLHVNKNDWEETFYQQLARNFGFKVNAEPFELLAKSLPNVFLAKHRNSLKQVEAMLFGQAGLLEKYFSDAYPQQLQNEYNFLKQKFRLKPIEAHLWKQSRMRPVNFPSIRISQFAALVNKSVRLFSGIIESRTPVEIRTLLEVEASEYWQTHYTFDAASPKKDKHLGTEAMDNIIINTMAPFLFVYGKQKVEERYCTLALELLEQTEGEHNGIISKWDKLGMLVKTAYSTQALLQLKNEYCDKKRCLQCAIGNKLLTS